MYQLHPCTCPRERMHSKLQLLREALCAILGHASDLADLLVRKHAERVVVLDDEQREGVRLGLREVPLRGKGRVSSCASGRGQRALTAVYQPPRATMSMLKGEEGQQSCKRRNAIAR